MAFTSQSARVTKIKKSRPLTEEAKTRRDLSSKHHKTKRGGKARYASDYEL